MGLIYVGLIVFYVDLVMWVVCDMVIWVGWLMVLVLLLWFEFVVLFALLRCLGLWWFCGLIVLV